MEDMLRNVDKLFNPKRINVQYTDITKKAYDRVPREELWYCMRKSGIVEKYVTCTGYV